MRVTGHYRPDNISWRFCLHQRAPTYLLSIFTAFRWMGALLHVSIREGTHLRDHRILMGVLLCVCITEGTHLRGQRILMGVPLCVCIRDGTHLRSQRILMGVLLCVCIREGTHLRGHCILMGVLLRECITEGTHLRVMWPQSRVPSIDPIRPLALAERQRRSLHDQAELGFELATFCLERSCSTNCATWPPILGASIDR